MFEKFEIEPRIRCVWESDDQAIEGLLHSDGWAMLPDYMTRTTGSVLSTLPMPRGWVAPYSISAVIRPHRADNQTLLLLIERMRAVLASSGKRSRG